MMEKRTLDLNGTYVATGVALYRIFYSPIILSVYLLLFSFVGIFAWLRGDFLPVMVACVLLIFPVAVIHAYLDRMFLDRKKGLYWKSDDRDFLSFRIVRKLKDLEAVSVEDLLLSALQTSTGLFIVRELGFRVDEFLPRARSAIKEDGWTDTVQFLKEAKLAMLSLSYVRIGSASILYTFFKKEGAFRQILHDGDLSLDDLRAVLKWESFHATFEAKRPFWSPEALLGSFGGIGRSWVMGYTDELDRLTDDISDRILWTGKRFVRIHEQERQEALRILEKSALHDLLLVGRVGVGKKTLVENIAYELRLKERGQFRAYTRMLILRTEELLSGVDNPDTFLLHALNKAQKSGRFILLIPDLSLMIRSGGDKIRAILMKFLREENVQLIGIMGTEDYHRYVKTDPMLDHFFEKLTVNDATHDESMAVMMEHYFIIEQRQHVHVTYKSLRGILTLCERYLGKGAFPGKAVEVLEDAMMLAKQAGDTFVRDQHIREVISQKANMNVTQLSESEKDKLLRLNVALMDRIIGQDAAIHALVGTLKRARLELHTGSRPLGTFLFLGPTGVGKTHTAKVLAEEYFGSVDKIIRLDMNEFSTEASIAGIVGSTDGGEVTEGYLTRRVQDNPFSLVLLDEIEKAHPKVLNLFLQILDEGVLTDHTGTKTDFRNTIIVATSNAGALFIRDFIARNRDLKGQEFKKELIDTIIKQHTFTPEFVNRFDEVILYYPLDKEEAMKVAILMLNDIVRELQEKRGITLKVQEDVVQDIVERGYSREFGAREMRRVIIDMIENYVANYMLSHDVKRGEEIVVRREGV